MWYMRPYYCWYRFFIDLIFPNKFKIIIETVKIALGCVAIFSLYISFINLCLARKHKQTSIEMEKKNKAIEDDL